MTAARPDQVHINRGTNRRFGVLVRRAGCRNYQLVGQMTQSRAAAIRRLALTMVDGQWKRGVVTFSSDHYDPTPIFWMNR